MSPLFELKVEVRRLLKAYVQKNASNGIQHVRGPAILPHVLFECRVKLTARVIRMEFQSLKRASVPWPRPRKWQLTRPLMFLLVAVFTDDCLAILNLLHFVIFIRHRTAENNHRHLSHGFKNILFGDNMHYVDLYMGALITSV